MESPPVVGIDTRDGLEESINGCVPIVFQTVWTELISVEPFAQPLNEQGHTQLGVRILVCRLVTTCITILIDARALASTAATALCGCLR